MVVSCDLLGIVVCALSHHQPTLSHSCTAFIRQNSLWYKARKITAVLRNTLHAVWRLKKLMRDSRLMAEGYKNPEVALLDSVFRFLEAPGVDLEALRTTLVSHRFVERHNQIVFESSECPPLFSIMAVCFWRISHPVSLTA